MKTLLTLRFILPALAALPLAALPSHADWASFRGSDSSGIAAKAKLPIDLKADQHIAWAVDLPGRGLSSPIIIGDRVFVTASSGADQRRLHVICFSAKTGKVIWKRQFRATGRTMTHRKTCVAAPTPVSDGKHIFALYSSNDLVCLDLDGNLKWLRGLTADYPNASNSLGLASSPVVAGNVLIVQSENDSESFAAGIDIATGRNLWKKDRPKAANWTSPTVMSDAATGKPIVALQSSKGIHAVDPATGAELWYYDQGASTIPSSTPHNGVLYVPSNGITALKPETDAPRVKQLWRSGQLRPGTGSPMVLNDRIYVINRAGVLTCSDITSGKRLWQLRLKGPFSASSVAAGTHLYCVNEKGLLQVVDITAPEGEIISSLDLKETILGTPSIAHDALFVRSDNKLWRIGE